MTALENPRWLALAPARRTSLLEQYHDVNVSDVDWWDDVYEMFVQDCEEQGIRVRERGGKHGARAEPAIYFSGFWSQGDGACFEGHVEDWAKFFTAIGRPELVLLYQKCDEGLSLSWSHTGRYYHEQSTSFSSDLIVTNPYEEATDPLQHAAWEIVGEGGDIFENLEGVFIEFVRECMRDLYSALEEEYDYLTSDETIVNYLLDHCDEALVEPAESDF